jgi:hypothetical protein
MIRRLTTYIHGNFRKRRYVVGIFLVCLGFMIIAPALAGRLWGNGDGRIGYYDLQSLISIINWIFLAVVCLLLLVSDTWLKNLLALLISLLLCLGILEIFLRIYDPFQFRVSAREIILPRNMRYVLKNDKISKCDPVIIHTKNTLGFRGPEYPIVPKSWYKIIFVGGSTTECFHISDGKDWPSAVGAMLRKRFPHIWYNNAGFDGHSTFGHLVLLHDILAPLHPQMIVFLIGWNDIGINTGNYYDVNALIDKKPTWRTVLVKHLKTFNAIDNLRRFGMTLSRAGARHEEIHFENGPFVDTDSSTVRMSLEQHASECIPGFARRIEMLCSLCVNSGIEPVFITQPSFIGEGIDSLTGADRGRLQLEKQRGNGKMYWEILELYNRAMVDKARACGAFSIDLAHLLPKKSEYFYDIGHFSNRGSQQVAEIVGAELSQHIAEKMPEGAAGP